ncbi:MAG TPA: efflux RND transporter permease subunit, partial [Solimonas sp.]|nr:efflux RND transporter permease subunit [Solimonas sp.]
MQGLVRIALARPYTFIVLALLILIVGPLAYLRTPTDIFPAIRIPVIAVAWQYTGLPADQMAARITTAYERVLTTTVNDIEHIESTSLVGFGIVKIFFQPGVDIATANAQVTAVSQTILRTFPTGTTPPLILNYNASTVPIIQLALSGQGFSEQNLGDLGLNLVRTQLVTVPGAGIPYPFGGKTRQIAIDIDNSKLQARGLGPQDVSNALAAQNLILPVGTQKIGSTDYSIRLNNAPEKFEDLNDLPIKAVDGTNVYMRDVGFVHDGNATQTNIVHVNDSRSVLLTVFKIGATSTLAIVDGVKERVRQLKDLVPDGLKIDLIGDQSVFVRGAVDGVLHEGILAASLTSLMILL